MIEALLGFAAVFVLALLRVPLEQGRDLVRRIKYAAAIRSARKEGGRLYIQVDPEVLE